MNHQTFNKKSYGFLLYFILGTPNPFSFCIHTLLYRVIAILLQTYNPVATKTDIGRRKDEEGRLNCR